MNKQNITADFVYGQLRVAAVAFLAYAAGKGWLQPADVTFYTAMLTSFGPLIVAWGLSIYANLGKVYIPVDSTAAAVAKVEKEDGTKTEMVNAVKDNA